MYQPRRAGSPALTRSGPDAPTRAALPAPRRSARTWYASAADRVGAVFLGLAVTATAGALAMSGASAAPLPTSVPLQRVVARLRADVPPLEDDRYLAPDLAAAAVLVGSGALAAASDCALPILSA